MILSTTALLSSSLSSSLLSSILCLLLLQQLLLLGNVRSLSQLTAPLVTIQEQLSIDKQGIILLQGKISSILAVDPLGIIVTVPHTRTEAQLDGSSGQLSYDSYFHRLEVEQLDVAVEVNAKRIVADELFIEMMIDGDRDGHRDDDVGRDRDRSGDDVEAAAAVKHGNILVARQVGE